jgi:hypothetical protein
VVWGLLTQIALGYCIMLDMLVKLCTAALFYLSPVVAVGRLLVCLYIQVMPTEQVSVYSQLHSLQFRSTTFLAVK